MANKKVIRCFLCGKQDNEVNHLIRGKYGYVCDECIIDSYEIITDEDYEEEIRNNVKLATPSQIKFHLDEFVIGQDEAKRTLAVSVFNHYKRIQDMGKHDPDVEIQKSNILMIGQTGSGKTYLVQSLAKFLGVPFTIVDATGLTEAGYVGNDVETIIFQLLQNANMSNVNAEKGIIYIDEVDKLACKGDNLSTTRDVGGQGVQQALLKIIEGTVVRVPLDGNTRSATSGYVNIDTKNILFICGGAFNGLEKIMNQDSGNRIGFGSTNIEESKLDKALDDIQPQDIVKYGMIPEFVGRLPIITSLNPLSEEDLLRILTEPKDSLTKQYQKLFSMDGVKLEYDDAALERIAELAIKRNIGARGLRSIMEKSMKEVMFSIPDINGAKKIVITKDTVDGIGEAQIFGTRNKKLKLA